MELLWAGIAMGLAGTVAMDIWAIVLNRAFGQPLPNWGAVGRWAANLPVLFHDDIGAVAPVRAEVSLGWIVHYGVGVIYGVFWALVAGASWLAAPTFVPVWIFALLTLSAGWFLLHPGLGLGWALSKTPNPWKGRIMGLIAHTVFGLGMFLGALAV